MRRAKFLKSRQAQTVELQEEEENHGMLRDKINILKRRYFRTSSEKLCYIEQKMFILAIRHLNNQNYEEALMCFEHVLVARKFKYGPGHELVDEVHVKIADTLKRLGRLAEAEHHLHIARCVSKVIKITTNSDNSGISDIEEVNICPAAKILKDKNKVLLKDLKFKLRTRILLFGDDHKLVKEVHLQIANTLIILGIQNEAIDHYYAACTVRQGKSKAQKERKTKPRPKINSIVRLDKSKVSRNILSSFFEDSSDSTNGGSKTDARSSVTLSTSSSTNIKLKRSKTKPPVTMEYKALQVKSNFDSNAVTKSFISLFKKMYDSRNMIPKD